jgi:hypothetical protein
MVVNEKVVTLPYDPLWTPLDWAKAHCLSYITNRVRQKSTLFGEPQYIDYFFADEKDATLFRLKWLNYDT